jgi:hypothetical protein
MLASVKMVVSVALALSAATDLTGQVAEHAVRAGRRVPLPLVEEIALARSAAPASISARARVLILVDTGYVVASEGASDVTCVVNRSWNRSVEPHCYDVEGSATVMRIELHRNWLRHSGKSEDHIDREIAQMIHRGDLRLPRRPAMSYMMSSRQVLYNDSGRQVGSWKPHIMLYYPSLTNAGVGLPAKPEMRVGMVANEGTAESSLMIIMPRFSDAVKAP